MAFSLIPEQGPSRGQCKEQDLKESGFSQPSCDEKPLLPMLGPAASPAPGCAGGNKARKWLSPQCQRSRQAEEGAQGLALAGPSVDLMGFFFFFFFFDVLLGS